MIGDGCPLAHTRCDAGAGVAPTAVWLLHVTSVGGLLDGGDHRVSKLAEASGMGDCVRVGGVTLQPAGHCVIRSWNLGTDRSRRGNDLLVALVVYWATE